MSLMLTVKIMLIDPQKSKHLSNKDTPSDGLPSFGWCLRRGQLWRGIYLSRCIFRPDRSEIQWVEPINTHNVTAGASGTESMRQEMQYLKD